MKGKLWKEAQEALKKISDYAVVHQTAKIEVVFLNNSNRIEATKVNKHDCIWVFSELNIRRAGAAF